MAPLMNHDLGSMPGPLRTAETRGGLIHAAQPLSAWQTVNEVEGYGLDNRDDGGGEFCHVTESGRTGSLAGPVSGSLTRLPDGVSHSNPTMLVVPEGCARTIFSTTGKQQEFL